jgi:hypothetical protein
LYSTLAPETVVVTITPTTDVLTVTPTTETLTITDATETVTVTPTTETITITAVTETSTIQSSVTVTATAVPVCNKKRSDYFEEGTIIEGNHNITYARREADSALDTLTGDLGLLEQFAAEQVSAGCSCLDLQHETVTLTVTPSQQVRNSSCGSPRLPSLAHKRQNN